jgi:hypothetical protein
VLTTCPVEPWWFRQRSVRRYLWQRQARDCRQCRLSEISEPSRDLGATDKLRSPTPRAEHRPDLSLSERRERKTRQQQVPKPASLSTNAPLIKYSEHPDPIQILPVCSGTMPESNCLPLFKIFLRASRPRLQRQSVCRRRAVSQSHAAVTGAAAGKDRLGQLHDRVTMGVTRLNPE